MEDASDANAKVLRVRALLKRGGKTPVNNTIIRTENVVATSHELQSRVTAATEAHAQVADTIEHAELKRTVLAIGAVRRDVGESYGLFSRDCAMPDSSATPSKAANGWPPAYAHDALRQVSCHAARLVALCRSFATDHRRDANVENDVAHAIIDVATHLHEAYAQLDDEVFKHGEHDDRLEVAARLVNRRARQLASRARFDAHGEVFASIEFNAACTSLVNASAVFNQFYIGNSLYAGANVHGGMDIFEPSTVAAESHLLLAETLKHEGLKESTVTNTLARASRHSEKAEAILEVDDAKDPLDDSWTCTMAGQPLGLREWASEGVRTGVAQFDVIGGFSMALDGEMVMHTDAIADAEWLCLRARVTPCHLWQPPHVVARTVATAAWKRMRYDADVEDDDGNRFSFRPSEEQLRAAARVGIALCGRPPQHRGVDHGLLVVDVGIAPNRLGMVVAGNHVPARATLHKAVDAIGYMFSQLELDRAHDSVDSPSNQCHFLDPCEEAEPAAWVPEPQREDVVPTEPPAVAPSVGCVLESVPETIITAHEAFEHTLTTALVLPTTPYDDVAMPKSEFPEADATSKALSAALAVTIRESPRAFDDLATQINTRAQPGYLAAMADYDSDALAQRAAAVALAPSVEMYRMLDHQGERAIDVAASLLGLKDLEPVVMTEPKTVDEPDSLDGSYPGSGTPSSEELEELV